MRAWKLPILVKTWKIKRPCMNLLIICLDDERSQLYERINHRVDLMFEAGLLDEPSGCLTIIQMCRLLKGLATRNSFPIFEESRVWRRLGIVSSKRLADLPSAS